MRPRPIRILAALVAVVTGLLVAALWSGGAFDPPLNAQQEIGKRWLKPAGAEADYVGNAACRPCHAREFAAHSLSPHARTVRQVPPGQRLPEFQDPDPVTDEVRGITYTVRADAVGDRFVAQSAGRSQEASPNWVFGSGTHAWSYLGQNPAGFLEFRISYYRPGNEWNFTPGRGPEDPPTQPLGTNYSHLEVAACFGCHSTLVVGTPKGLDFERLRPNIGCEACHGPGRTHVESARGRLSGVEGLVRPPRMDAPGVLRLCGACHRLPGDVDARDPGIEGQLARFPGVALPRSKCFTGSQGKLTCTTCHDPHQSLSHDPAYYDARCGSCHGGSRGAACSFGKTTGCAGCHLPEERVGRKLPLRFHNHWIRSPDRELMQFQLGIPASGGE